MNKENGPDMDRYDNNPLATLHWKEMWDALSYLSMIIDPAYRILVANKATAEILGMSPHDLVGKPCHELFHDPGMPPQQCPYMALAKNGNEYHGFEIKVRDRTYLASCNPVRDAAGTGTHIILIATDITRQKCREVQAKDCYRRYQFMTEQLPGSIWATDTSLRFTSIGGTGIKDLGIKPDQLIGKSVEEFYSDQPGREDAVQAHRRALLGENVSYEIERNNRLYIAYVEPLHDDHDKIIGTLAIAHDITDQKRAQFVLEQINKKLTLLNSITQHDTNNKICALMGYLELLKDQTQDPDNLAMIDKKIYPILDDIREQIAFTRAYQNIGLSSPQWQDVTYLIGKLHADGIAIQSDVPGLLVFADPLLEMVFQNLLDNALRHGMHVTDIRVSAQETASGLVLIWQDNGAGIEPEIKEKIFDRGFGKNTGLGLFLIKEILSITGITIRETGTSGTGACFEMHVPEGAYGFTRSPAQ
ncbi:MAG: PAS domain-containing protein [Methanoregula sp.]